MLNHWKWKVFCSQEPGWFPRINRVDDKYLNYDVYVWFRCVLLWLQRQCRPWLLFCTLCEYKNGAFLFGGWRGAALLWSLLPRLLSAGWGGVGGRWIRRATDMSKQRFIPWKKSNCSKASFPYFSDRIRLIHSSLPTDFPLLSPQYSVLTLTQIITLALSLKKLLSAPTAYTA